MFAVHNTLNIVPLVIARGVSRMVPVVAGRDPMSVHGVDALALVLRVASNSDRFITRRTQFGGQVCVNGVATLCVKLFTIRRSDDRVVELS